MASISDFKMQRQNLNFYRIIKINDICIFVPLLKRGDDKRKKAEKKNGVCLIYHYIYITEIKSHCMLQFKNHYLDMILKEENINVNNVEISNNQEN